MPTTHAQYPDAKGRFGAFGGRYVPETLVHALDELERLYTEARADPDFWREFDHLMRTYVGRPTPLYHARGLTDHARENAPAGHGAQIYLKREDLAHTGAHKINNTIGQALLTKRMGKKRIIAETGAGQHGVASATAAAHFGLDCHVYMGAEDARRQRLNVIRMKMLGADVIEVDAGSRTLKDATNEAMRDWMGSVESTHYILGSVVGPHPFPMIVRDFQSVIGNELREQFSPLPPRAGEVPSSPRDDGGGERAGRLQSAQTPRPDRDPNLPTAVIACVGGGSNAAGIFYPLIDDPVRLIGVEAGGTNASLGHHAAPLSHGSPGILHGSLSYVLQDDAGQTAEVHSCSAGLDYPGVGPEHSYWKDAGRVEYTEVTDAAALDAFLLLARSEGIIPALETAHAVAKAVEIARELPADATIVVNLSGRGDKDVDEAARLLTL